VSGATISSIRSSVLSSSTSDALMRVEEQLAELDRPLDLISHKVRIYEDIVDSGSSDHDCNLADDNAGDGTGDGTGD
jgi:hypothetical protein